MMPKVWYCALIKHGVWTDTRQRALELLEKSRQRADLSELKFMRDQVHEPRQGPRTRNTLDLRVSPTLSVAALSKALLPSSSLPQPLEVPEELRFLVEPPPRRTDDSIHRDRIAWCRICSNDTGFGKALMQTAEINDKSKTWFQRTASTKGGTGDKHRIVRAAI